MNVKYDIKLSKLIELSGLVEGDNAFPKLLLVLLTLWKEDEDNTIDLFLSKYPNYIKLLEIMEKDKWLIKKEINYDNAQIIKILENLYTPSGIDSKEMLKEYNKLWAGKMGKGSSGNKYALLEIDKNKEEFSNFLERHPEILVDEMRNAVLDYFSTLKNVGNVYEYAYKSNTFLADRIDSYITKKHKVVNTLTEVEGSFYRDL